MEKYCLVGAHRKLRSLSVIMVEAVVAGVEMAVAVETRSAPVAVAGFPAPGPSRKIGMVWRRSSPLARQLAQVADVVRGLRPARFADGNGQR